MCIEQATFAHGVIHLFETGHGNSEAQQIGFKVGTHGRIEEAEDTAFAPLLVFSNSKTYNGAATGPKRCDYGIKCFRIVRSPCDKSRQNIGRGKE